MDSVVGPLVTRKTFRTLSQGPLFRKQIQRRAAELGKDLEQKSDEEWLSKLGRSAWRNGGSGRTFSHSTDP